MNPTLTPDDLDAIERGLDASKPWQNLEAYRLDPDTVRTLIRMARSSTSSGDVGVRMSSMFGEWLAAHATPEQIESYNRFYETRIRSALTTPALAPQPSSETGRCPIPSEHEFMRWLALAYNHPGNDKRNFTRWNMKVAFAAGAQWVWPALPVTIEQDDSMLVQPSSASVGGVSDDEWALVPKEPTEAMLQAFSDASWQKLQDSYGPTPTENPEDGGGSLGYGYRAMIAASTLSPPPKAATTAKVGDITDAQIEAAAETWAKLSGYIQVKNMLPDTRARWLINMRAALTAANLSPVSAPTDTAVDTVAEGDAGAETWEGAFERLTGADKCDGQLCYYHGCQYLDGCVLGKARASHQGGQL